MTASALQLREHRTRTELTWRWYPTYNADGSLASLDRSEPQSCRSHPGGANIGEVLSESCRRLALAVAGGSLPAHTVDDMLKDLVHELALSCEGRLLAHGHRRAINLATARVIYLGHLEQAAGQ